MEVVAAPPPLTGGVPFRDRDVREWSRIDSITGAFEQARLETDSWSATTSDASHRYGKVVDSRARTGADGSLQAQASRQLEVFQSRAAGAHLQVVKTKTVSSSRWSGKSEESPIKGFENLQLPLNPLDLSSQKSKASVGRSANRRPPTRPSRNPINPTINDLHNQLRSAHFTAATNLHRVSRLCHQIHESAVRNAFGRKSPSTSPRGSADGSVSGVEITEIESSVTSNSDLNSHSNLTRTKSNSSEDIHQVPEKDSNVKSVEDLEDLEQLQSWRRNAKVRRSLQVPAAEKVPTIELPESTVNVKKLRDELEKGRRLTTALRNNSISTDLNALDNIIQSISSASSLERSSTDDNLDEEWLAKHKQKRESFVTVESLQAVKGRLRHTSSPYTKQEDSDDGIVTEDQSTVKSYVYGMEKMMNNKKSVIGTGSLESRSKLSNGTASHKNEDWYNRRKSYGFEKVHGPEEPSSISLKSKNLVESSTDSGICRSSEIMIVPTATKANSQSDNSGSELENSASANGLQYGKVKKMTSIFNQEGNEPGKVWSRRSVSDWKGNEIKSTTITIPIVKNNNVVDLSWNDEPEKDINSRANEPLLLSEDNGRKGKKVEFCKTEVHFAAESGKVNIVETDEKPPPTQNFRRRRRNSGPTNDYPGDFNKNGLPVLHFGDTSYEKTMFGITDDQELDKPASAFSIVTVNTNSDYHTEYSEEERKDLMADNDNLKGILKNKPVKPKPYHLGQLDDWGVKLRHVPKETPPIWKSTVTVHSTVHDAPELPEFQKLLRNLRPTTKKTDYLSDNENRYSDSFTHVRMVPATKDNRRSSWSVADRIPLVDDIQENKGYSTKVNFGDGQATVVQNDQSTWPRMENLSKDNPNAPMPKHLLPETHKSGTTYNKYSIPSNNSKYSPVVLRKSTTFPTTEPKELIQPQEGTEDCSTIIISRNKEFRNLADPKMHEHMVLRQPKQSEMTYFGVGANTPREVMVAKKHLQKPDLLQNHQRSLPVGNRIIKPRRPTPEQDKNQSQSPIYENLKPASKPTKYSNNKDFDASILDELTKAADQILQVVNGYTSEDCQARLSSDEEEPKKLLDTISETKSWKNSNQDLETKNQLRMRPTLASAAKVKVKRTSSTSSVDSLSRDRRKPTPAESRRPAPATKSAPEKPKKKPSSDGASSKASTKARRLQRASSREALLQSHGSSSEDLPTNVEAPVRKPRLIKKTKATQLTMTSGLELKKPQKKSKEESVENVKSETRILRSLPEIRHKTAVSTITSTVDKCSRDRSKSRNDESKSRGHSRRESSSKGTLSSSSTRPISATSRGQSHQSQRATASSKDSGVTQHRISTANIKRCHRSEASSRH